MEREQAIKILSRDTSLEAVNELKYYAGFCSDKVIEQIQEAMDMGAEALKKQSWIPCSERLPKEGWAYLVVKETASGIRAVVMTTFLSDGTFAGKMKTVAWMPLPEPYKDGE